jgi:hypothetical protein
MKTAMTLLNDDARDWFPCDLSGWIDRHRLVGLTLQTAAEVGSIYFGTGDYVLDGDRYRPQVLLALLSYSYATGRFASSLVTQGIVEDETMRYLATSSRPDPKVLRRFRRQHRQALKQCLLDLFRSVWKARHQPLPELTGLTLLATAGQVQVPWNARFIHNLVDEVEQRLDRAVQFDFMELDE